MPPERERFVAPANWQLRDPDYYREHVWSPARSFRISRALWLDALTLLYDYEGKIFKHSGRPFPVPDIDDVFSDAQNRWMSDFFLADESGMVPRIQCRQLDKLRLIAIYC